MGSPAKQPRVVGWYRILWMVEANERVRIMQETGVFFQAFADWAAWRYGVVVSMVMAGKLEGTRTESVRCVRKWYMVSGILI